MFKTKYVERVYNDLVKKNKNESEYLQAAQEILESLEGYVEKHPELEKQKLLERFLEPERFVQFKVVWTDDKGNFQVNRGYRVQYNSAIGPYKGGLRLHPSVNASIIKFLGLEQVLKNLALFLHILFICTNSDIWEIDICIRVSQLLFCFCHIVVK